MEDMIYWLVGIVGVPVIQFLKKTWGLKDMPALWLTLAVAFVLGIFSLFVSGQIAGVQQPDDFLAIFGQILAAATLTYKALISSKEPLT